MEWGKSKLTEMGLKLIASFLLSFENISLENF